MGMSEENVAVAGDASRRRGLAARAVVFGTVGVVVAGGVTFGGIAYVDARARDVIETSQAGVLAAVADCEAVAGEAQQSLALVQAALAGSFDVADLVRSDIDAALEARTAVRALVADSCQAVPGDDAAANDALAARIRGQIPELEAGRDAIAAVADALETSSQQAKVTVATEALTSQRDALTVAVDQASASVTSLAGQVADPATLDALGALVTKAKALVEDSAASGDLDELTETVAAVEAMLVELTNAQATVAASHQAWADAQAAAAAAAAPGSSGGSSSGGSKPSGGSSGGGSTGGGSTGGGSTGGGSTGGAGVVTWSACDGYGQNKYVDGVYVGGRACVTAASASAAVAPYQNPGNGTCALYGSVTGDHPDSLASAARNYTYARFSFSQVSDFQVKMTIETCLAP